jgi:predicted metal-dependent HD superfamily phosphohydrolase
VNHVLEVLEHWRSVDEGPGWGDPTDRIGSWVAVLLHDAVYDAGEPDNEARSAALVEEWVHTWLDLPCVQIGDIVTRARTLVLQTAAHGRHRPADLDRVAALFLDCDMAILGASPERFDSYCDQIATEYADVAPGPVFEAGRRTFLQRLLTHPIYLSEHFQTALEDRARANIARALEG